MPVLRWLVSCLVFFIFPFLLLAYGMGNHWSAIETDARDREFKQLDGLILRLVRDVDPGSYLYNLLQASFQRCIGQKNWKAAVEVEFSLLRERFPGMIELVALDKDGRLLQSVSDLTGGEEAIRNLYFVMRAFQIENVPLEKALQRLLPGTLRFLGPCAAKDQIVTAHGSLCEGQMAAHRRFYLPEVASQGFLFVFFDRIPEWGVIATWDQARKLNGMLAVRGMKTGVFDISGERFRVPFPPWKTAVFDDGDWRHFEFEGKLFSVFALNPTGRVWASSSRRHLPDLSVERGAFCALGSLMVGALFWWSFPSDHGERLMPLRTRLILLFIFACGLPLLVIQLMGRDYIRDLHHKRVVEYQDLGERLLRSFDTLFHQRRSVLERVLTRRFRKLRFNTANERRVTEKVFNRILTACKTLGAGLVDEKGSLIWKFNDPRKHGELRSQKFLATLIKGVLAKINRTDAGENIDTAGLFMDSLTGLGDPIEQVAGQVGHIINFLKGQRQTWSYFLPIHRDGPLYRFMLAILWKSGDLENILLSRIFRHAEHHNPEITFYAKVPTFSEEVMVQAIPFKRRLQSIIQAVDARNAPTFDHIDFGSRRFLVVGLKSREMGGACLLAIKDDSRIRDEVARVRGQLLLFSLLCVGISTFLGVSLGRHFLEPIGNLSRGVEAINRRNFDFRIPIVSRDELGVLSSTFNDAMSGMSELEIGRIGQEILFPNRGWRRGEYQIDARTLPASELSGDYFDLQVLPDRRILFLVGDVTGHGVPAALVMAMAKAVFVGEIGRAHEPHDFLRPLHKILLRTMKKRRMMTCFIGILDPKRNRLTCSNAGHNFPVIFRRDGSIEQLEDSCMPLGSWKTAKFESFETQIGKGDRFLLYSDGLVEALVDGMPIGVNTLIEAVAGECLAPDPKETCERLLSWHHRLVGDSLQSDDITMLVLARKNDDS
ncbi:hypothetical protein AUK22_01370 [bacterium CG2_30_54_10]|nr:MAG: hypothetical protein AUK22_01370 [bacterium CG2_30_54_10]